MNLVLKYRIAGENEYRCLGAARITVGDRGGLTVYAAGGEAERIAVERLDGLSVASVDDLPKSVSTLVH